MTESENHSIDAEQQLLGAILVHSAGMNIIDGLVDEHHFFEPIHQRIFSVCQSLFAMGKTVTAVTVQPFLPPNLDLGGNKMTARKYVAELAASATTVINAPDFARLIRDLHDLRKMQEIGQGLSGESSLLEMKPVELAGWAMDQLSDILGSREQSTTSGVGMGEAAARAVDAAAKAYQNDGAITGLSFGLRDLDAKTGGAQAGDLIVVAGRPSMGKTGIALGFARAFAQPRPVKNEHGLPVMVTGYPGMIQSLEMPDVQLTHRIMADMLYDVERTRVAYNQMRHGTFSADKFEGIADAARVLGTYPIRIEQQPGVTVSQIATRARQHKRKHGLSWLVVDYLQLVQASDRYKGQRTAEVSEITFGLKNLARELGVPVIALSQLSRAVEAREDKRPMMSDLRDSGSIEQDADIVMFVYRPAYYLQHREPKPGTDEHVKWQDEMLAAHNKLFAIIGKNRGGPTGPVELFCDIGFNAFRDLSHEYYLPNRADPRQESMQL